MTINLSKLTTEQSNEHSTNIDSMSILEIIELMNAEDRTVAEAVNEALPQISSAIEAIYQSLKNGGRLFDTGAGTSGRLGVLDASKNVLQPSILHLKWFKPLLLEGKKQS